MSDVEGGVEVTLSAGEGRVADLRERARAAAARRGAGTREGPGHDGQHMGRHGHGLRLNSLPPTSSDVRDVEGGAVIRLRALVPEHVDGLREQARANADAANAAGCGT